MNKITKAVNSGSREQLLAVLGGCQHRTIARYIMVKGEQPMDSELLCLMLDYIASDQTSCTDCIFAALLEPSLSNLRTMLGHPQFAPHPMINLYASRTPLEAFALLLASDKFGANLQTMENLLSANQPEKIRAYLDSNKFIIPSPQDVANLATKYKLHEYSLSLILGDPRVDLSLLPGNLLKEWLEKEDLFLVLKERIPDTIYPMVARHIAAKAKAKVYHEAAIQQTQTRFEEVYRKYCN